MANRRNLKKRINGICFELAAECISARLYGSVSQEDVNSIMGNIFSMQTDCICRISHVEPGMKAKVFFRKLREDMQKRIDEIIDQIAGLG